MAGWHVYTDNFGNDRADYKAEIDGVIVEAGLHDCDGDGVDWYVSHDGELYQSGEVFPEDGPDGGKSASDEEWAWERAKILAQGYICAVPGYPMVFALPPKIFDELVIKETKNMLLEKCDQAIREFEEAYPNHPLIKAINGNLKK